MDEIILIGAGGHARACIDVIEIEGRYHIAGLVEKDDSCSRNQLGYTVIGTDDDLLELRKKYENALITVGQIKSASVRVKLFKLLSEFGYNLPVIVSPRAHVSPNSIVSSGTIVMHDVIINSNAEIGKNCIINNKALVEHDAVIGDHCHIATGAIINGNVAIGCESFIGSGAITKESITIGINCVVGAGVVLKTNIAANQLIKN